MQQRKINRVVDLRDQQGGRLILNLDCGHNPSVFDVTLATMPKWKFTLVKDGFWDCVDCPDPTPVTERQKKTAQQLYREAGEPDIR